MPCKCKKGCRLARYCACFAAGGACDAHCGCQGCANGRADGTEDEAYDDEEEEEEEMEEEDGVATFVGGPFALPPAARTPPPPSPPLPAPAPEAPDAHAARELPAHAGVAAGGSGAGGAVHAEAVRRAFYAAHAALCGRQDGAATHERWSNLLRDSSFPAAGPGAQRAARAAPALAQRAVHGQRRRAAVRALTRRRRLLRRS
jgi:hypothetical protein